MTSSQDYRSDQDSLEWSSLDNSIDDDLSVNGLEYSSGEITFMVPELLSQIGQYLNVRCLTNLITALGIKDFDYTEHKLRWLQQGTIRIREKIQELGWTEKMLGDLGENCLVAGSFPLQCLLDEYWDESDIDIFTVNYTDEYHGNTGTESKFLYSVFKSKRGAMIRFSGFDHSFLKYCTLHKSHGVHLKDIHNYPKRYCECKNVEKPIIDDEIFFEKYIDYLVSEGYSPKSIIMRVNDVLIYVDESKMYVKKLISEGHNEKFIHERLSALLDENKREYRTNSSPYKRSIILKCKGILSEKFPGCDLSKDLDYFNEKMDYMFRVL